MHSLRNLVVLPIVISIISGCSDADDNNFYSGPNPVPPSITGSPCSHNGECMSGYCSGGICTPAPSGCRDNSDCFRGFCSSGSCVPQKSPGETCTFDYECLHNYCNHRNNAYAVCDIADNNKYAHGSDCQFPAECKSNYCIENKCRPNPAHKGNIGTYCEANAECITDYCGLNWKCEKRPLKDGSNCSADIECESHYCKGNICTFRPRPNGYACKTDNECESNYCDGRSCANKPKENDSECSFHDECRSGYCDKIKNICTDKPIPQENGSKCAKNDECISNRCDTGSKKCVPEPQNNGGTCVNAEDCKSRYCVNNTCQTNPADGPGENGDSCYSSEDCISRYCINNICRENPDHNSLKNDGEYCRVNRDCRSNYCLDNICQQELPDGLFCCEHRKVQGISYEGQCGVNKLAYCIQNNYGGYDMSCLEQCIIIGEEDQFCSSNVYLEVSKDDDSYLLRTRCMDIDGHKVQNVIREEQCFGLCDSFFDRCEE